MKTLTQLKIFCLGLLSLLICIALFMSASFKSKLEALELVASGKYVVSKINITSKIRIKKNSALGVDKPN